MANILARSNRKVYVSIVIFLLSSILFPVGLYAQMVVTDAGRFWNASQELRAFNSETSLDARSLVQATDHFNALEEIVGPLDVAVGDAVISSSPPPTDELRFPKNSCDEHRLNVPSFLGISCPLKLERECSEPAE